ncbi:hypothetical protein IKS57_05380 [bacterium]|nr:hypothetical protein [bacterium]
MPNQITASITNNNSKTTNSTLNIYSSIDASQTLDLNLSNVNASALSNIEVD